MRPIDRRKFMQVCGAAGLLAAGPVPSLLTPGRSYAARQYGRARLLDAGGKPLKSAALAKNTNYIFSYPYQSTPCFLLNLNRAIEPQRVPNEDGSLYEWSGGVGPHRSVVAFTAICAHNQTHPTPGSTHIQYDPQLGTIHCCAHKSEFDPSAGGGVVSGASPRPLAAVLLQWDRGTDELWATGMLGPETFDAFFSRFRRDLRDQYGSSANAQVEVESAIVRKLEEYTKRIVTCERGA